MINIDSSSSSGSDSDSVDVARKTKNVARILALSILAVAFMHWSEFFASDLGDGGIISRRQLKNRNMVAVKAREERRKRNRRLELEHGGTEEGMQGQQQQQQLEEQRSLRNTIPEKEEQGRRSTLFAKVVNYIDPRSIAAKTDSTQLHLMQMAESAIANGEIAVRVHSRSTLESVALFVPSELLIEVINPNLALRYSVTIVSPGRYTGSAMQLSTADKTSVVFSWQPSLPGQYEVLVHEINGDYGYHKTPLVSPPYPISVGEGGAPGLGLSKLEDRVQNKPPCQTLNDPNLYSAWDGDWLGPEFQLEDSSIRTGWSFVPSDRMNCKLETFDSEAIRRMPEKKSIYILGRSVERGVFLSLVDLMLEKEEKQGLEQSVIGKCWGRASITKGNLEVMYQDYRVNSFEDPTKPRFIECHNEKLVKQPGSSFIANATEVWDEIFQQDESNWPSVIFMVTGYGTVQFIFEHHVKAFVDKLPPTWAGTLFLGDFEFSARHDGLIDSDTYDRYLNKINTMVRALKDPRVRWFDGPGIAKEMKMYSQTGEEHVARTQHFHRFCSDVIGGQEPTPEDSPMVVCSNITEMVGQLLLGHALGPKAEFMERVRQKSSLNSPSPPLRWCHACPRCMLPFHMQPRPEMTCVDGPLLEKTDDDECPKGQGREPIPGLNNPNPNPMVCPESCLGTPVVSEFGTESDTVYVRQCTV